jgi:hypothetical protein
LDFRIDPGKRLLTLVDDGKGMNKKQLERYHDIAATAKIKGRGIGFAGIGVKLALLMAEHVVTETRNGAFHRATRWKLESPRRAPWAGSEPAGLVVTPGGTAVTMLLKDRSTPLLKPDFVERVIQAHFSPLLDDPLMEILQAIYPRGVAVAVNDRRLSAPVPSPDGERRAVRVRVGAGGWRGLVGIGYLWRSPELLPEGQAGIAVSTYGKIIKRGWEWLGLNPRNPRNLTGLVEVPHLVALLTTNKADFLKDANSLRKYYRLRKSILAAVEPVLRDMGEIAAPPSKPDQAYSTLGRQIERVIGNLLAEFPELSPLLGRRLSAGGAEIPPEKGVETMEDILPAHPPEPGPEPLEEASTVQEGRDKDASSAAPRHNRPGMSISMVDEPGREGMGWLAENTVYVNRAHPAFRRAAERDLEEYHVTLVAALVLSEFIQPGRSPQQFVSRFLSRWGKQA